MNKDGIFLPYQNKLSDCVFANPVTVVEKSRRTGYTWAASAISVLITGTEKSPMDTYYMGYDLEMAREFIEVAAEWAKTFSILSNEVEEYVFTDPNNPEKNIKAFRIEFANGRKIVALPSVPRALRGKQGFVLIDEAAFHDDLKEVLKAAFALLIWGGKVLILSTHNGDENPYNELINDIRALKKPYKLLRCTFDDALKDGLYRRICQKTGKEWTTEAQEKWRSEIIDFYGDDADEELFCIPSKGSGAYLTRALIEKCQTDTAPVLRLAYKDDFASFPVEVRESLVADWLEENVLPVLERQGDGLKSFGFDFARSGDLSVFWVVEEQQNLDLKTLFSVELSNLPHTSQEQILFYIIDRLKRFHHGAIDARGNGSYISESCWQKYGSGKITQVMLSQEWYRENMPPMKARFEDNTILIPKDADVLNDLRALKVVKGVAVVPDKRTTGKDGKKRHGDSAIALAFAVFAAKTEAIEYDYESYQADDDDDEQKFNKGAW